MPPKRQHPLCLHWQLLLLWLLLCSPSLWANSELRDARLKVAFVYNFLRFTEWPAETGNTLNLCLGNADGPMETAFNTLIGQQVNGRRIRIISLERAASTSSCHVFFIKEGGIPIALRTLAASQPNLLTIGDEEGFAAEGGVIGLVERDNRLQFEVNLEVARKGSYKLSSQLLKLAITNHLEKK